MAFTKRLAFSSACKHKNSVAQPLKICYMQIKLIMMLDNPYTMELKMPRSGKKSCRHGIRNPDSFQYYNTCLSGSAMALTKMREALLVDLIDSVRPYLNNRVDATSRIAAR